MKTEINKTEIKDIYNGKEIEIWQDGNMVYFTLGMATISIPKEVWKDVRKDLKKIVKVI